MQLRQKAYFENLDGLRAIAALSVVCYHISNHFDFPDTPVYRILRPILSFGGHGGELGVTFFFILSGFLITYLMFEEQQNTGNLNIPFFYYRRVLRIWPAYYISLFAGFILYPATSSISGNSLHENASPLLYSVFAANFDHIFNGPPSNGILGVQWSVAIEEQFYLLWPVLFVASGQRKVFPPVTICIVIGSYLFFYRSSDWSTGYYHLLSNMRYLASGALLAWICFFNEKLVQRLLSKIHPLLHAVVYTLSITFLFFEDPLTDLFPLIRHMRQLVPNLFFIYVITEQNFDPHPFFRMRNFVQITRLGKISYGIYLYHMIAIYTVLTLTKDMPVDFIPLRIIASLAVTWLLSFTSYKYVESFFLALKSKWPLIR